MSTTLWHLERGPQAHSSCRGTVHTAQSTRQAEVSHSKNLLQGTPYSFLSQMLCSHLNILATHWAGPEAEEVTEPMSAMCGATHSFRISCKRKPQPSGPKAVPQCHSAFLGARSLKLLGSLSGPKKEPLPQDAAGGLGRALGETGSWQNRLCSLPH